jgi:uncharacterized protein DUF481
VKWLLGLTTAVLLIAPTAASAQNDTVSLRNGDRIVGTINGLSEGELRFKTDYILKEFLIDWQQVLLLESRRNFRVTLADGRQLTGTIGRYPDGRVVVTGLGGPETFTWQDILSLNTVKATIWAQLAGQLNSGFSYASDGSDTQFSASGSIGYAADRYSWRLSGSSNISGRSDSADDSGTNRNVADLSSEFPLWPKWFAVALLGYLNSDQQDLQFRATVGGGIGRWLVRTQHTQLTTVGGLVYTRERYRASHDPEPSSNESANNIEAIGTLQYAFYRFKTVEIKSNGTIYASFTTPGRVRLSAGPTLNIEVAHDLYWNFTLYENYDSHPPVAANKNDFGVTNAIGWKF